MQMHGVIKHSDEINCSTQEVNWLLSESSQARYESGAGASRVYSTCTFRMLSHRGNRIYRLRSAQQKWAIVKGYGSSCPIVATAYWSWLFGRLRCEINIRPYATVLGVHIDAERSRYGNGNASVPPLPSLRLQILLQVEGQTQGASAVQQYLHT